MISLCRPMNYYSPITGNIKSKKTRYIVVHTYAHLHIHINLNYCYLVVSTGSKAMSWHWVSVDSCKSVNKDDPRFITVLATILTYSNIWPKYINCFPCFIYCSPVPNVPNQGAVQSLSGDQELSRWPPVLPAPVSSPDWPGVCSVQIVSCKHHDHCDLGKDAWWKWHRCYGNHCWQKLDFCNSKLQKYFHGWY